MRVCVFGLWHLGCVTAACLARGGHEVIGLDPDAASIERLQQGEPPIFEPGLMDLIAEGLTAGKLRFTRNVAGALPDVDLVWVTFDTPVDENDVPQVSRVVEPVRSLLPQLPDECLVLVSSQLPVGTTRRLVADAGKGVTFAYSPENLRLGSAIVAFTKPDRVVVGLQSERDRDKLTALWAPFTTKIVFMGLEAAEMTKHAINAFLATSVAFMNEIATICEMVGADAKEVERALKSEERIGPRAYLSPGGPFAGGTLARDVATLATLGHDLGAPVTLIPAVRESNDRHRGWALRKLEERLGSLDGRRIAILGLTYKPGTDTLRRSSAVELALALQARGAIATAFDPAIRELPAELSGRFALASSPALAVAEADAVVVATPWPQFRELPWPDLVASMATPTVVDAGWFLAASLQHRPGIAYAAVGLPWTAD
jgi:UDPglucose 6-dehydrogenase